MRSIVAPTSTIARRLRGRPNALRESTTSSSSIEPNRCFFASSSSSSFSGADDLPSPGSAGVAARDLRRRIEEGGEGVDDEDGSWSSARSAAGRRRRSSRRGTSMSTRLSHAGLAPPSFGDDDDGCRRDDNPPLSPPIELATTYERPADGEYGERGRVYSRSCNPTRRLLEEAMGRLEMMTPPPPADDDDDYDYDHDDDGGPSSCDPDAIAPTFAFSSGMAAATSLLLACQSPTRVLLPSDVYHGVPTLLRSSLVVGRGVSYESVDMTDVDGLGRSIERNVASMAVREEDDGGGGGGGGGGTLVVWIETPSNPLCRVTDIRAVCDAVGMARARTTGGDDDDDDDDEGDVRILTVVDSTWAPPCITLPLGLGADVVLHSGTKYLAGHSDALIGIVSSSPLTSDGRRTATRLRIVQTSVGAVASPLESWLTLRGLRTLHLRVERQCETAMRIAMYLNGHESVMACHYPGLPSHPGHDVARRQMRDGMFGGMLSFELESECAAMAVAGAVRVIRRATSLGGTETLIEHRASIEPRKGRTSPVGLLRLSVGLEDAEDLIRDLEMALEVATRVTKSVEGR